MKIFLSLLLLALTFSQTVIAQKKNLSVVASQRAEKTAKVLSLFNDFPPDSIVFDIFRKAKGVAVFSEIEQINFLVNKFTKGKGVFSARTENGWGVPIFLNLGGAGYDFKLLGKKNYDAVFFIMSDKSSDLVKKNGITADKIAGKKLALGPIVRGEGADWVMQNASVIYYTFENGRLSGQELQNDVFFNSVQITIDNNLNKHVYKKKSQIILAEDQQNFQVPTQIEIFRNSLNGVSAKTNQEN